MSTPSQSLATFSPLRYATGLARQAGGIYRGDGERSRTQRDAVAAFLVRIASAGILYLSQVVLARWMGAFEYGIYVFVWTWVLVLSGLSHLGLPTLMIRLVPEYLVQGEHAQLRGLLLGSRAVAMLAGTAVACAGLGLIWLLGARLNSHYAAAHLPGARVRAAVRAERRAGRHRPRSRLDRGGPGSALHPAPAAAAGLHGRGARSGSADGTPSPRPAPRWLPRGRRPSCRCCSSPAAFRGELPKGSRRYDFKRWLGAALPLMVITGCELALQNADVLIVSAYMSPTEVGMYFAAAKTMSLVMFVHYAVGSAVANRFAALNARGDHEGLKALGPGCGQLDLLAVAGGCHRHPGAGQAAAVAVQPRVHRRATR